MTQRLRLADCLPPPRLPRLPYAWVARILALLLLTTAGLKIYGLAADPVSPAGILSSHWVQAGVIEVEVILAIWLLSGALPIGSWLVSLLLFSGVRRRQLAHGRGRTNFVRLCRQQRAAQPLVCPGD